MAKDGFGLPVFILGISSFFAGPDGLCHRGNGSSIRLRGGMDRPSASEVTRV